MATAPCPLVPRRRAIGPPTATAQVGNPLCAGSPDAMSAPAVEGSAAAAFRSVLARVHQAAERSGRSPEQVRVVAVSKTKPASLLRQVYDAGHRCFGENYVQEIVEKARQVPPLSSLLSRRRGFRSLNLSDKDRLVLASFDRMFGSLKTSVWITDCVVSIRSKP